MVFSCFISRGRCSFTTPTKRWLIVIAIAYGVGLALALDEFGMWLHFGGSFWQRVSYDAITIVGNILLLAAFTPPTHWAIRRWFGAKLVTKVLLVFSGAYLKLLMHLNKKNHP